MTAKSRPCDRCKLPTQQSQRMFDGRKVPLCPSCWRRAFTAGQRDRIVAANKQREAEEALERARRAARKAVRSSRTPVRPMRAQGCINCGGSLPLALPLVEKRPVSLCYACMNVVYPRQPVRTPFVRIVRGGSPGLGRRR